jgi:ribosomal-protein-alanine N-acetyltransferase
MVGFALDAPTADPHVREIAWMGVAGARQGQGVGTRLLDRLTADLRARGITSVEVSTVAASAAYAPYESTRAFYHARGFWDVRVDPDYYWPGGDRLVLRKSL